MFFLKFSKYNADSKKAEKNWENFLVSNIGASKLVSLNYLYSEQDTSHRQALC